MGCVPSKRTDKHRNTLFNFFITPSILAKYYLTIDESIKDTLKVNYICRKFKIPEPEPKIFWMDLVKLYGFGIKGGEATGGRMSIIMKDYQNLSSSKSYFYTSIHYVCIPNFNIEICLTVFVLFCKTHNLSITASNEFPYLNIANEITEYADLIKSWQEFIGLVYKLHEEYKKFKFFEEVGEKTDFLVKKYEGMNNEKARKKVKYFTQLRDIYKEFVQDLIDLMMKIRLFSEVYNKNIEMFEKICKVMNGSELKKCDNLIHLMF